MPLSRKSAATTTVVTVFCLTTGTNIYARSLFHTPCFANGFAPLFCPLIKCYMPSFTQPMTSGSVSYAMHLSHQAPTTLNTAQIAESEYSADKPQNVSKNSGLCHAIGVKNPLYNAVYSACFYEVRCLYMYPQNQRSTA